MNAAMMNESQILLVQWFRRFKTMAAFQQTVSVVVFEVYQIFLILKVLCLISTSTWRIVRVSSVEQVTWRVAADLKWIHSDLCGSVTRKT